MARRKPAACRPAPCSLRLNTSKEKPMSASSHRWRFLGLASAGLLLAGLGLWVVPAPASPPSPNPPRVPAPPATSGLIVHEWGTFLSVQGSDGATLGGMVDSEEKLPLFVRERDLIGRNRACLFQKMETPVTYFYTDRPMTAEVKVDMPRGLLTHWFPAVQAFGPPGPKAKSAAPGSFLDWGKVRMFQGTQELSGVSTPLEGVRK